MSTTSEDSKSTKISAIDKALAAARARKASKSESPAGDAPAAEAPATRSEHPKAAETRRTAASDDLENIKASKRAAAKLLRDVERQQRREARSSTQKGPTHMKKVARAGEKLPDLSAAGRTHLNELTTNLGRVDLAALALHIQHFNRVKATEMSVGRRFKNGTKVRIVAGDLMHLGKIGTVESGRPLRCFVSVPGSKKPVYVFTSELEAVEDEPAAQQTGTEG